MQSAFRREAGLEGDPIDHYQDKALLSDRQCEALRRMAEFRGRGAGQGALGHARLLARLPAVCRLVVSRVAAGEFPREAGNFERLRRGATALADLMGLPR